MRSHREERELTTVAPAWLVVSALAAVAALSLTSLGLDLAIGQKTAARTAQLVDEDQKSVV